jgi:hypothetical protein
MRSTGAAQRVREAFIREWEHGSHDDANTPLVAGLYDLLLVKMMTLTALIETAGVCFMPVKWGA